MFNINEIYPDEQSFIYSDERNINHNYNNYVKQCIRNDIRNVPRFLIPNKNEIENIIMDYGRYINKFFYLGNVEIITDLNKIIALTYSFSFASTLSVIKSNIKSNINQGRFLDISYQNILEKLNNMDFTSINLNTIAPNGYIIQHMGNFLYNEEFNINNSNDITGKLEKTNDEKLSRVKIEPNNFDTVKKIISASCIRHFACHIEEDAISCLPLWIIAKFNLTIKDVYDEIGLGLYDAYYMDYKNIDNFNKVIKTKDIPTLNRILHSGYIVQFSVDQTEFIKINNNIITIKRPNDKKLNEILHGLINDTPFSEYKNVYFGFISI